MRKDNKKTPHQIVSEMWEAKDRMEEFIAVCSEESSRYSRGAIDTEQYTRNLRTYCNEVKHEAQKVGKLCDTLSHSVPRTPKKSKNHSLVEFGAGVMADANC